MLTKVCGIYKILNIITRDYYLGSSIDLCMRWREHCWKLRKNMHRNSHLQSAWNKYGEQAFEFSILLLCDVAHKLYFEQGFIDLFKPAYNIAKDAKAPMKGMQFSDEHKHNMSEAQKGKHLSEEHKRNISEANKGSLGSMFNKHHSEETKRKLSEAGKSRCLSEEVRHQMREARLGKQHTEETKRKISKAMKGKSNHRKGTHDTEETKRKMSEAQRCRWEKRKAKVAL